MSVAYIHCQFSRGFPGSATLQRGFWSRAGARRSQGRALVQDLRNGPLGGQCKYTVFCAPPAMLRHGTNTTKYPMCGSVAVALARREARPLLRHGDAAIGDTPCQPLQPPGKALEAVVALAEGVHLCPV